MFNKKFKKQIGVLVLSSQLFSAFTPLITFAASQSISGGDIQNSLETVGTKANRLKTVGQQGVDESSGAFTYSYPLALPKGLSGLEPSVVLSYNSQNTENSIVGYGWNMAIPYIERSAKQGVDKIYTKNDFVSSLGGELIQKTGTINQYLQKIDDGSYQLYTLNNNIWTLTDRSGNIYTFGTTLDSRFCDTTCTKIQKYYLTEVKDILGNKIKYFYEKKNGYVYPKEIIYTVKKDGSYSNKIIFEREDRLDKDISYKSQFRSELSDRIKTIRAFTDNVEVAKLELTYTLGQNGSRSLLANIKESRVGTDGLWSSIPDTKLEYELGSNLSFAGANTVTTNGYSLLDLNGDSKLEFVNMLEGITNGASWTVIDYNGDYLSDMYYSVQGGSCYSTCPATSLLRKNTDGTFTNVINGAATFPATSGYNIYSQIISGNVSVQDINADGLQDINNGSGFSLNFGNGSFGTSTYQTTADYFEDINADGLPDLLKEYSSSTNPSANGKYFYLNNGLGWNSTPELTYKLPVNDLKATSTWGNSWDAGLRFVDINADGLVDIIKSYSSNQYTENYEQVQRYPGQWYQVEVMPSANIDLVFVNTGSGFVSKTDVNLGGNKIVRYDQGSRPSGINAFWQRQVFNTQFFDANGDGSLDFGGGASSFKKQDILKTVTSPLGAKSEITYKGSVLGNNPKLPINILTVSEIKTTETNKNLVSTVKYTYENSKMYYDKNNIYDRRFAGFEKVTTEEGGKRIVKYFHQGDSDNTATFERGDSFHNIGRVYKEEVYAVTAGVATKYTETYRTYGVYSWDGQVYKYPKLEVSTEYDKTGNSFSKAIQYDYDLASRLPKKTENFGEVKWNISTGTFSDLGEDYVLTKNIYNTKRPQKLLAEESLDINGKFLDKKIYFYDELPFGYVEKGLLSEERNYSNANSYVKTTYTYNDKGLVASKTDNTGAKTSYTYDSDYNPLTVTNALNQTVTSTNNKVLGVATSVTDPNGKVVQTVYDGFGNVKSISATSPADGQVKLTATKNISYTGNGMVETENIYTSGAVYKTSTKYYDSFGRLIKTESTNTDNSVQTMDVTYNSLGQMTKVSYPYDVYANIGVYNPGFDTLYTYDELGRVIQVSQGDLKNFTSYQLNGKIVWDNSTEQHKKEYKYNSLGKLASVREHTSSNNFTETKYDWNLLGNLTRLTDALGNIRNFQYDTEGRLLKQEDLHAPTDDTFGTYTYTYDPNGLLISKTDPSGNVATFEYDILNRPKKESFGNITTYTYDTCVGGVGKLCTVENSDYTQNLSYNKTDNILTETKVIDDKTFTNTYTYNDLGQNISIALPDNSIISYTYDKNGKQKSATLSRTIGGVASTTQVVTDAKYNIDGTIKELTQGNNLKSCYEYTGTNGGNVLPRLTSIKVGNSDCVNNLLFQQDLKYNLSGSIIENKEIFSRNNFSDAKEITNKYTFDTLQRLTKSERIQNNISVVNNLTYNAIGNILTSDSSQYQYDGGDYKNPHAPSVIGNTAMTYDLNGNILDDGKNIYEWNKKNTLATVSNETSITSYVYDLAGERIKETAKVKTSVGTSTFLVANNTVVATATTKTLIKDLPLITETSYNELKANKLNSQNKVEMLFALALESNKYVKDVCKSSTDVNCQKKEAIRFVAGYLYGKHNIKLSSQTLEEMYQVYLGNSKLLNSADNYNKINNIYKNLVVATPTLSVSTSSLATFVYGTFADQDKTLLGYVLKQKKIASLFGSEKFVSKETFAELQALGITYSDIIIKDMLIDVSFAPYASCNEYLFDSGKRICEKTAFVKHLFAIVRYETDKDLSPEALDELYEVTAGNLSIPNNIDDYNIYDVKILSSQNFANQTLVYEQSYTIYNTVKNGFCILGYYSGSWYGSTLTTYSSCKPSFSLPTEVVQRANDLFKVEIVGLEIPKTLTDLNIFLNTAVPTSNLFTDFNTVGINHSYRLGPINYQELSSATIDVSNLIIPWAKGLVTADGLRFTSVERITTPPVGQNNFTSADQLGFAVSGISSLKYTFRTDALQADRKFLTPLVTNPKDDEVYANVLAILARIDKDYKTNTSQIISAQTYAEIKNTNATNTESLVKVFDENEKLQKDDTLKAVWDYYKNTYNIELTRESLEELHMVWSGKMSLPTEELQYSWATATTTKVLASVGTSTVKSYLKIISVTALTEAGVNYLNILTEPAFTVFDRSLLTNLSEVPGVFSLRSLFDKDIVNTKMYVSTSSKAILKTAGIEKREDILQFTTTIPGFTATSTIKRENKIYTLTKINSEIIRIKNIKLSRESLEEIYYILNNKLVINPLDNPASGPQEISGLVSKYEFNGALGSTDKKKDTLRPDKPIFQESNVTSVNGRKNESNNAYQFVNSYLKHPNQTPVLTNNSQTISFWMKANTGGTQSIYSFGSVNGTRNFFAVWYNNGRIVGELGWVNGSTNVGLEPVSVKAVNDNIWHKVDVTIENSPNTKLKIYIDGVLDKEATHASAYNLTYVSSEVVLGQFQNYVGGGLSHPYYGALDDVKVYSKALSAAEIQTAYTNDLNITVVVPENLGVFEKTSFGILDPVEGVISENEKKETDNITYSINNSDIKNVSRETVLELQIVGATTTQQILDVFNLSKTTDKDSKISFFQNYFEVQKNYKLSREALEEVYLVYIGKATFSQSSTTQDRDNFGDLSQVSTETKIDTNYSTEINSSSFNTGTTSTSTVVRVTSPVAFVEMTSIGATTSTQVKSLFSSASSTLGKDAKLYYVWKWAKDNKNVELTRLTLEEMWNINIDRQVATLGQLATSTTTVTPPAPLPANAYYKMDGALGTSPKKQDEVLTTRLLTENVATTGAGRKNDTNGAYSLPGSGMNKLLVPSPLTLTNNTMTYSVWVKTTNCSPYQRVISQSATDGSRNFIDLNFYNCKPYFEIGSTISGGNVEGAGSTNIANNTWYKLDLVVTNSPKGTLKLYVNGNLDRTLTSTSAYSFTTLPNAINLGCYGNTTQCVSPVPGSYDDFKIFTRELTSSEILREYQLDTGTLPPVITTTTTISSDIFNRDRYKELEYISPISVLKYAYDIQTGAITEDPVPESVKNTTTTDTQTTPLATLDQPTTTPTTPDISPENLSLLNPFSYPYTATSPVSINIQINGVTYPVNLDNYIQFYQTLDAENIDNLQEYLNSLTQTTEEIQYIKYYPSSSYEYDTRGYITINIPFNGKVVATVKYKEDNSLTETSYLTNNYLGTPVLLTNTNASTTEVILRSAWGEVINNDYTTNKQIPTDIGYTGHRYDSNSELTYAHARYYAGNNKVWLSVDPVQYDSFSKPFFLMNPQSQNGYSYANNNPVNFRDPTGRCATNGQISWQACLGWYDAGKTFVQETYQGLKSLVTTNPVTTVKNFVQAVPQIPAALQQWNQNIVTNSKSSDPRVSANAQMTLILNVGSMFVGAGEVKAASTVPKIGAIVNDVKMVERIGDAASIHAYTKHVDGIGNLAGREFGSLIQGNSQLSQYVQGVISTSDKFKELLNGRFAWWDERLESVVIYNSENIEKSTVFRPVDGLEYFDNLK